MKPLFGYLFLANGIIFGIGTVRNVLPASATRLLLTIGVLLYSGVGIAGIILGGNFLDYNVLSEVPVHGQHFGILLVEFGVGITVASAMITIFCAFAGRQSEEYDEEYRGN